MKPQMNADERGSEPGLQPGWSGNPVTDSRTLAAAPQMDARLRAAASEHPYPLLFATISGAHLYGFPSADSDFDLRGVHVLPLPDVLGLMPAEETIERSADRDGLEIDLVTHDVRKFFLLLLRRNGYVLEQLYSPLVVRTSPEHDELKSIAAGCITRHHAHHYLGFAATQWRLFERSTPPRVKPLLYVYRVLLTGIHLMRAHVIEANLLTLNAEYRVPGIDELIARKRAGAEHEALDAACVAEQSAAYARWVVVLEAAREESTLPDEPRTRRELSELLVRVRLTGATR